MNYYTEVLLKQHLQTSDNVLIPVTISIMISGFWLASRLGIISYVQKNIDDKQGILLPSLFFIVSPFVSVYIFGLYHNSLVFEILKSATPLVAVLTFFLGQFAAKRERRLEKEKQDQDIAKKILYSLEKLILFGGTLSNIEVELKKAEPRNFKFEKFQEFCKHELSVIKEEIKQIKVNHSVYSLPHGFDIITYLEEVATDIKNIVNGKILENYANNYNPMDGLNESRIHILNVYRYIFLLRRDVIKKDSDFLTHLPHVKMY